jgi:hypothetical protein
MSQSSFTKIQFKTYFYRGIKMAWELIVEYMEVVFAGHPHARSSAVSEIYTMRDFVECRLAVLDSMDRSHCCETTAFQSWALIRASLWLPPEEIEKVYRTIEPICQCEAGRFFLLNNVHNHQIVTNRRQLKQNLPGVFSGYSSFQIVP